MRYSQRNTLPTFHWLKSNLRRFLVTVIATLTLPLLPNATHSIAQQSNIPQGIIHTDTTFIGRIDANVIDVLMKELPKQTADAKETVLESKLHQTTEILGGKPVWLAANWPSVPTKITLSVADANGTCVSQLSKLWNVRAGALYASKTCKISLTSLKIAESPPQAQTQGDWQNLLDDAPKGPINFAMKPPKHFYSTLDELLIELPDYLGGGPVSVLTEGALSANLSLDPATRSINGFVQSKDRAAAQKLKDHLPKLLTSAIQSLSKKDSGSTADILQLVTKKTSLSVEQDRIRVQLNPKSEATASVLAQQTLKAFIGPLTQQSQQEKLRYAAIGILNYESAYSYFPPPDDSRGPDGPTGLSWRVHLLPFLGESELWQQFNMDEPWDSPANRKLLPKMPAIYSQFSSQLLMPADAPQGMTTLMAPISDGTILGAPNRVSFGNIADGSSNTILLVIVKDSLAVPWTAPRDYKFDPDQPASGLKFDNNKTPVVMCDGSTYAADQENQWLHLFEMNDEHVVELKE